MYVISPSLLCCKTWLTTVETEAAIFPYLYLGYNDNMRFIFGFVIFQIRINTAMRQQYDQAYRIISDPISAIMHLRKGQFAEVHEFCLKLANTGLKYHSLEI